MTISRLLGESTVSPGGQLDWWVKEHRPRLEWWGGYAVPMVGSGGSKLVIFVLRADHNATDGICRWQD